jgi:hypothetical protein
MEAHDTTTSLEGTLMHRQSWGPVRTVLLAVALFAAVGLLVTAATLHAPAQAHLADPVCPADTHWSVQLQACVEDTHW